MTAPFDAHLLWQPPAARRELLRADPALKPLFKAVGPFHAELFMARRQRTPFEHLLRAIIYQQVSTRAATTVHGRVLSLFPANRPSAARLLALSDECLRGVGLSGVKVRYLRALGDAVRTRALPSPARLARMTDAEIMTSLTAITGIGRWTVEILLIFHLGRPDVMPVGDLGVRRGFGYVVGADTPPAEALAARAQHWRPYRTLAAWYLWQANYLDDDAKASLHAPPA